MALKGSSHGETEPKKATDNEAGHNIKPPTPLETIPATQYLMQWQESRESNS